MRLPRHDPTPRGYSRKTMVLAAASCYERGKGSDRSGKKRYAFVSTQFETYTCKAVNMGRAKEEAEQFFAASHSGKIRVSVECDGNTMHFEDADDVKRAAGEPTTLMGAWEQNHEPEPERKQKREDGLIPITNRFASSCKFCGGHIPVGEAVLWRKGLGVWHTKCINS